MEKENSKWIANEIKIAHMGILVSFLALIRTLAECFRLQYYATSLLTFESLKPFLLGALITALLLLGMTLFLFYAKYKLIVLTAILNIILLVIVKIMYSLN